MFLRNVSGGDVVVEEGGTAWLPPPLPEPPFMTQPTPHTKRQMVHKHNTVFLASLRNNFGRDDANGQTAYGRCVKFGKR